MRQSTIPPKRQPRLLMLGASLAQIPGIVAAREQGVHVISCDNLPHSPGHALAHESVLASTFDPEAVLAAARQPRIDGIMTMGSDQPVLTAAIVAHQLGLPSALSVETARAVTDKRVMKKRFLALGLPTVPFVIYKPTESSADPHILLAPDRPSPAAQTPAAPDPLEQLEYPVVIKPVDSQGQRGIFVCWTADEVRQKAPKVLAFSRAAEILVESYYPSNEVTVSGWVSAGQARILTLTDRERLAGTDPLGVCLSHEWPSRYLERHGEEIASLTQAIVSGFGIAEGPIYFQFLIGASGVQINEIACRIGGAFESQFIPHLTGFNLTAAQIDLALGRPISPSNQKALE
ncbi:MAG: ATP-grasp domain-containing protein, partial [Clostridia bacterium]|nr:ATP-grasp domain-containing protein [Clostridia bacterium]